MSVNKTINYKIKKIVGMWGTDCKWIEDNFGLDNYWCDDDGVGVLEKDIPNIIKTLGKENQELQRKLDLAVERGFCE